MVPKELVLKKLNDLNEGTLMETLEIVFTDYDHEKETLTAEMPFSSKVTQPLGLLHGGVSAVLAETVGSVLANIFLKEKGKIGLGMQITSNHLSSVNSGQIIAKGFYIRKGNGTQVIQVDIVNEKGKAISHNILTTVGMDPSNRGKKK